jgi:hypothetical protein
MNICIPESRCSRCAYSGNFFAHHWYVACNDTFDKDQLAKKIDKRLCELNDDYAVERRTALKDVMLDVLSEQDFMNFMTAKGKIHRQHKFPRVLKGTMFSRLAKVHKGRTHLSKKFFYRLFISNDSSLTLKD